MTPRILIVEDDRKTAEALHLYLHAQGYEVQVVHDGVDGLYAAETGRHDLVLLDLMLPGMHGMDVCRRLRQRSNIPIVMLTAQTLDEDQIRGLELGADDYILKPFSPRQVVARIRSVLRRHRGGDDTVRLGPIELDWGLLRLRVGDDHVELTKLQASIVKTLLQAKGRPVTREQILEQAFDSAPDCADRTVDAHIKNLRRKIALLPVTIATTFGVGYRIDWTPGSQG